MKIIIIIVYTAQKKKLVSGSQPMSMHVSLCFSIQQYKKMCVPMTHALCKSTNNIMYKIMYYNYNIIITIIIIL